VEADVKPAQYPWIFSLIEPAQRFLELATGNFVLGSQLLALIHRAWCQEVRDELVDPEWPCAYWDNQLAIELEAMQPVALWRPM